MKPEIYIAEDGKYIVCRVKQNIEVQLAKEFSKQVDKLSREHGIKKFLFDVRGAPNVESASKNYSFAYDDMADMGLQKDALSAVLADPEDRSHDFIETVARNAGYNVRLFSNEQEAIAWLTN